MDEKTVNAAERLFAEIQASIVETLDGFTDEEWDDILTALEQDTGYSAMNFEIAEIIENL